jgi:ACGX-repeat protein
MKRVDFNFAHSAQGYMKRSSEVGAACGSGDKPSEETEKGKPTACGSACGSGDKTSEETEKGKPTACGSACGSGDKES